jgi:hypothetical protein
VLSVLTVSVVSRQIGREQDGGMSDRRRPDRRQLTRADLPDRFTPDAVRRMDVFTVRRLSQPGNGILDADEQRSFDEALRAVMQDTTDRLGRSLRRTRWDRPRGLDAGLRRSYARTEERLAAQAERARQAFPQFTRDWDVPGATAEPSSTSSTAETDDDISLGALESEIEQTSDTLELLERIASIQQQQLEHQRTQALRDVRGVFFALIVSVAVIVAGVAPLVEADPDERRLIVLWTLAVCAAASAVYAIVRALQSRRGESSD